MQHSSYRQRPPSLQPTSGSGSAPAPATIAHRPAGRRYSLWRDIYWGAVWGDFSPSIGIPGAVVQALIGYVPVLGTITALRDAVADVRQHDHAGLILNLLAAFPVLGGLAKTADVLHELRRLHRVYASHQDSQQDSQQQNETTADVGKRTGLGCLGFTISIVVLVLSMAYGWGIHIAAQSAATYWHLGSRTAFAGNVELVATLGLAAIGLSIGEVICVGSRAWLGVIFLPAALYIGLLLAGGLGFLIV